MKFLILFIVIQEMKFRIQTFFIFPSDHWPWFNHQLAIVFFTFLLTPIKYHYFFLHTLDWCVVFIKTIGTLYFSNNPEVFNPNFLQIKRVKVTGLLYHFFLRSKRGCNHGDKNNFGSETRGHNTEPVKFSGEIKN